MSQVSDHLGPTTYSGHVLDAIQFDLVVAVDVKRHQCLDQGSVLHRLECSLELDSDSLGVGFSSPSLQLSR